MAVFQPYPQLGVDPLAGANWICAAPAGRRSTLAMLSFFFHADANVANRTVRVQCDGAIIDPYLCVAQDFVTANQAVRFICHINNSYRVTPATNYIPMCLPNIPLFNTGDNITISVGGIQAGDTISLLAMFWHCWPLGPA